MHCDLSALGNTSHVPNQTLLSICLIYCILKIYHYNTNVPHWEYIPR